MAERALTLRELNRATLARQMLLERAALPAAEAVARVAGMQAQLPNPPYIGLWSRLRGFQREELTRLIEGHQVVRATLMRATLHLVTADDYLWLRSVLQSALTRAMRGFVGKRVRGLDVERLVAAARAFVDERPRTFVELRERLADGRSPNAPTEPERDVSALAYVVRTHLPLVQVPPGGVWGYGGSPAHANAETWLGRPLVPDGDETRRQLVLRYLAAFGPATDADLHAWSGMTGLTQTVAALRSELHVVRDERGAELLDVPGMLLPAGDEPAPVRYLPEFDNLLLAHADRARIVPEAYRRAVYLTVGRVRATFLVDGFVAGTWRVERERGAVRLIIEPLEPLPAAAREALAEEGEALLRFIAGDAEAYAVRFAGAS